MTLRMYDPAEHFFEVPIEVQLDGYPCIHRVFSICYGRNPYGVRKNKVSYAISDWKREGLDWRACKDLPTAMKLANLLDHPFPKNRDRQTRERARGRILNQT